VIDKNKDKIDKVIHRYILEQSNNGHCSTEWRSMRKELIEQLKAAV